MLLLWLMACDPVGTAVPVPWVSADPIDTEISFEETWLPVTIRNTGTERASVSLRVDAPFVLIPDRVQIAAADDVDVLLIIDPEDYQRLEGTITMRTPLQTALAPVSITIDADRDLDGFTAIAAGGDDCDDTRAEVHPAAFEYCNGRDDNCNEVVDEDAIDTRRWYADNDEDLWGFELVADACSGPAGAVIRGGDCDDNDALIHPGVKERYYDGVDQDCRGDSDYDGDADGYDSDGYGGDDCNDGNPNAHPGADDPLGGSDLNCDGIP